MRSAPAAASPPRPPSASPAPGGRGSAGAERRLRPRHNTAGLAAVAPDCPGQEDRARGADPKPRLPPARPPAPGPSRGGGAADPARGLTPNQPVNPRRRPCPAAQSARRGASPVGFPSPFLSRGAAGEPRVGNGSRAPALRLPGAAFPHSPHPGPARTFNSSAGRRAAGEQAHLPAAAAAARGNTEEGSSEPPRRLSAGAGGTQRRGPDGRFPELLLRSSVLTAPRLPRPGAPPACLASWRHAHPGPSLDAGGRGGTRAFALARFGRFPSRERPTYGSGGRECGAPLHASCLTSARGCQRPFLPFCPQDFSRALGQVSLDGLGGGGGGECLEAALGV
ncbi:unnamed protein product [Rangifer tarandus platyrhynchus]|uniref:Uncharacterized protein n=1 Tax=Rangifer tarandus platyrhynchus TaxID=3082113 RepID=A0AC59YC69_RANTA